MAILTHDVYLNQVALATRPGSSAQGEVSTRPGRFTGKGTTVTVDANGKTLKTMTARVTYSNRAEGEDRTASDEGGGTTTTYLTSDLASWSSYSVATDSWTNYWTEKFDSDREGPFNGGTNGGGAEETPQSLRSGSTSNSSTSYTHTEATVDYRIQRTTMTTKNSSEFGVGPMMMPQNMARLGWQQVFTYGSTYTAGIFNLVNFSYEVKTLTFMSGTATSDTTESVWSSWAQTANVASLKSSDVERSYYITSEVEAGTYNGAPKQIGTRIYSPDSESFWVIGSDGATLTTETTLVDDSYVTRANTFRTAGQSASGAAMTLTTSVTVMKQSEDTEMESTFTTWDFGVFPPTSDTISEAWPQTTYGTEVETNELTGSGLTVDITYANGKSDTSGEITGYALHDSFTETPENYGSATEEGTVKAIWSVGSVGDGEYQFHVTNSTSDVGDYGQTTTRTLKYSNVSLLPRYAGPDHTNCTVQVIGRFSPEGLATIPTPSMNSSWAGGFNAEGVEPSVWLDGITASAAIGLHVVIPYPSRTWTYETGTKTGTAMFSLAAASYTYATTTTNSTTSRSSSISGRLQTEGEPVFGNSLAAGVVSVLGISNGDTPTTIFLRGASVGLTTLDATGGSTSSMSENKTGSLSFEITAEEGQVIIARSHIPTGAHTGNGDAMPTTMTSENFITGPLAPEYGRILP
jgi:hypothetical protein